MDYYRIAEEPLRAASSLKNDGMYRMSVSMATLAIDLLLKSVFKARECGDRRKKHVEIRQKICYPK